MNLQNELKKIADAIRAKSNLTETISPTSFAGRIAAIPQNEEVREFDEVIASFINKDAVTFSNISLTTIPRSLFYQFSNLTTVDLPNVTTVNSYGLAAYDSSYDALTTVNLPSCQVLGDYALANRNKLQTCNMPSLTTIYADAFYDTALTEGIKFDNVTTLQSSAFNGAKFYDTYPIFPKVTSIVFDSLFANSNITSFDSSIMFPNIKLDYDGNYHHLFYNCTELVSIKLFLKMDNSFYYYDNYSDIAFNCENLIECIMPNVIRLGDGNKSSFYNCNKLTYLELTSLKGTDHYNNSKYKMFEGCQNLEFLSLPNITSISTLGQFMNKSSLKAIVLPNTNTVCTASAYSSSSNSTIDMPDCYIYVPQALLETYQNATNWCLVADQFRPLEEYTIDGTTTGEFNYDKIGIENPRTKADRLLEEAKEAAQA